MPQARVQSPLSYAHVIRISYRWGSSLLSARASSPMRAGASSLAVVFSERHCQLFRGQGRVGLAHHDPPISSPTLGSYSSKGDTGYTHQHRLQLQLDDGYKHGPWVRMTSRVEALATQIRMVLAAAWTTDTNKATACSPPLGPCDLWWQHRLRVPQTIAVVGP